MAKWIAFPHRETVMAGAMDTILVPGGAEEPVAPPQLLTKNTTPSWMAFAANTVLQHLFVKKTQKNFLKYFERHYFERHY